MLTVLALLMDQGVGWDWGWAPSEVLIGTDPCSLCRFFVLRPLKSLIHHMRGNIPGRLCERSGLLLRGLHRGVEQLQPIVLTVSQRASFP